jgi:hypothetical protein
MDGRVKNTAMVKMWETNRRQQRIAELCFLIDRTNGKRKSTYAAISNNVRVGGVEREKRKRIATGEEGGTDHTEPRPQQPGDTDRRVTLNTTRTLMEEAKLSSTDCPTFIDRLPTVQRH